MKRMTKIDQIGKITIKKREIIIKCGKENKKDVKLIKIEKGKSRIKCRKRNTTTNKNTKG